MCGLFGHSGVETTTAYFSRAALEVLAHRGPNARNDWLDEKVYVGHARLSILDLSDRARQPMVDETGSCVIAVNGEVYNYRDLRRQLATAHRFVSESDSEVVLHGYKQWGLDGLVARLEGMYAFVIYDRIRKVIHLVRDRVGIKPLYYSIISGCLVWGSELKAIVAFLGKDRLSVDHTALFDFLTYRYIPTPKTMYCDVQKLPAGHTLTFEIVGGRCRLSRYWSLPVETRPITPDEAKARLKELLVTTVRDQMVSDVPLGFFLSGGIDSSAVVASAAASHRNIHTYSIDFEGDKATESAYARSVADRFGTLHQSRTLPSSTAHQLMHRVRGWYDEPFADSSALPTYLVCEFARRDVTVALSGDGGDEVFGGYTWYDEIPGRSDRQFPVPDILRTLNSHIKNACRRNIIGKAVEELEKRFLLNGIPLHVRFLNGMLADEKLWYRQHWEIPNDYDDYWLFKKHLRADLPPRTRLQYLDFHTFLPDDILTKVDRASMAVSLEVRVPLLATEIVEFAFSLPQEVRFHGGRLKGLLKTAMEDVLPSEITARPKRGFGMPRRRLRQALFATLENRQEQILKQFFSDCLIRPSSFN